MESKYCPSCKETKLVSNFSFSSKKNKYISYCKPCSSKARLKTYYQNKESHREKDKAWRTRIKEQINELKIECVQCGEDESCCLEFHHLDPNIKDMNIGDMAGRYGFDKIKLEIDKCVVLCANCHRKIHAGKIALAPDGTATVLHADID